MQIRALLEQDTRHSGRQRLRLSLSCKRTASQFIEKTLPVDGAVAVTFEDNAGLRLAVFVRPTEGGESVTDRDILAACSRDLPRHMLPRLAVVVAEFPLTSTMKIDRATLSRRAAALADESATIES